jgi:hypothetical protein
MTKPQLDAVKARTEKATVRVLRQGVPAAQGVLVPGGYILTAAHCISWEVTSSMTLGDHYIETIRASDGVTYKTGPVAIESLMDIAALAALDVELYDACVAFETFCEATEPVPVSSKGFPVDIPVPVHVLTHDKGWMAGRACRYGHPLLPLHGNVAVEFDAPIAGGTSGGPVIDNDGLLVGVISQPSETHPSTALMPRPHLALPVWVWNRIVLGAKGGA